jgi:hypothetical protein
MFNSSSNNYSRVETCKDQSGLERYVRSVWVLGGSRVLANSSALRRYIFADGTHSKIRFWITEAGEIATVRHNKCFAAPLQCSEVSAVERVAAALDFTPIDFCVAALQEFGDNAKMKAQGGRLLCIQAVDGQKYVSV